MDVPAPEVPQPALRELLFGDVPLAQWAGADGGEPPWRMFQEAAERIAADDTAGARSAVMQVLAQDGYESRHYLQAWDVLRQLGEEPPAADAKRMLGVVIDMPVPDGWDTLAVYEDGSCRYLNVSGAVAIREAGDADIAAQVEKVLEPAREIVLQIGPWDGPRPPLAAGQARLSFLCPSGLHFGQGNIGLLMQSFEQVRAVIGAGIGLIQLLAARET